MTTDGTGLGDGLDVALEAPERPDPEEYTKTLTGYDEIAVEQYFRKDVATLGRSQMVLRALYFVKLRRAGETDADAFRTAMTAQLGDVVALWDVDGARARHAGGDDGPEA